MKKLPNDLELSTRDLNKAQLDTPYREGGWSVLQVVHHLDFSITLLNALHQRWTSLLASLTDTQWQRKFFHPTHNIEISLWDFFAVYTWHGKHHIAHIENLKKREGWQGK